MKKRIYLGVLVIIMCTVLCGFAISTEVIYPLEEGFSLILGPGETAPTNWEQETIESYMYDDSPIDIVNGQKLLVPIKETSKAITISAAQVEGYPEGQQIEYGYVDGGEYCAIGEANIFREIQLSVEKVSDGAEYIYIKNISADKIHDITILIH